jgi:hypothetical protein
VFVTPSNHRVHHGQNDYCIDKNYGGILIIWDRLFGTFAEERDAEKVCFGIRKPLHSYNPLWGNVHVYADIWRASRQASGLWAKMKPWLEPPGGWRQPLAHFEPRQFARYEPTQGRAGLIYALVQYGMINIGLVWFLLIVPQASLSEGHNPWSVVGRIDIRGWKFVAEPAMGQAIGKRTPCRMRSLSDFRLSQPSDFTAHSPGHWRSFRRANDLAANLHHRGKTHAISLHCTWSGPFQIT